MPNTPQESKTSQPVAPAKPVPPVPTMTTASMTPKPPVEEPNIHIASNELDDTIIAQPMVLPDFTHLEPSNKNISFRWVNYKAGEGLRYNQCIGMGYEVAKQADLKPGTLSPYVREGGTKYINGDLILMKIDRRKYLGALKFKHNVAAAMADDAVQRTVSAKTAIHELRQAGAGRGPVAGKITVFAPDAADLSGTPLGDKMAEGELGRLGGSRDIGR